MKLTGMEHLKIYQEKNFLVARDLEAYVSAQAESCLWLIDRLGKYSEMEEFEFFVPALQYLMRVHSKQYHSLVSNPWDSCGKPQFRDKSFYFDTLYSRLGVEKPNGRSDYSDHVMWVHCVSYFRGYQRYIRLSGEHAFPECVWGDLMIDALSNGNLLLCMLKAHSPDLYDTNLDLVVATEANLMRTIDEKNGKKEPLDD